MKNAEKLLFLTLTALEPLAITSGSAESMAHECLGHVPGNMILGALACKWIRLHRGIRPDGDPAFRRLFLDGEISFGHALPVCEGETAVAVPLSYRRVKNHPSLPVEGEDFDADERIVFNVLATDPGDRDAIKMLWQNRGHSTEDRPKLKKMPEIFMDPKTMHLVNERKVWNMHVALARQRSAVKEQLFGYSALAAGTKLRSLIICRTEEAARDLEDLLAPLKDISVGHARSAGYGLVEIHWKWEKMDSAGKSREEREHNLFLLSQYLPFPSWENPMDNFRESLGKKFGQKPEEIVRQFVNFQEIQGYNSLWDLPRDSRLAMCMGSVIRVKFPEPVALPSFFELGGGLSEGYGRILADPAFLEKAMPAIGKRAASPKAKSVNRETAPAGAESGLPIWRLLRQRALERLKDERVRQWLYSPEWQGFLEDAHKLKRPTASQRNSLRDADRKKFVEMLDKTPGAQWKQSVCYCPFSKRKDHLDQIILKLLDTDVFTNNHAAGFCLPADLPGTPAANEAQDFALAAHGLFVRQLVSLWNKKANSGGKTC